MTLWALRRAGLGSRGATRTLLGFLIVLYSVFLGAIAVVGRPASRSASRGDGPLALSAIPAAAATLAIAAALALRRAPRRGRGRAAPRRLARGRRRASAAPSATRSATCARPTRACSARSPGGRSTPPSCGRCSTRSARRPRSPSSCSPTSSARSATRSRSPAPSAAAWSASSSPSACRPTSRSSPCSPTAPSRSGCPPPIGLVALGALRRTIARWSAEDAARGRGRARAGRPLRRRSRARRARARARAAGRMRLRPATSPALPAAPARVAAPAAGARRCSAAVALRPGDGRRRRACPTSRASLTDLSDTLGAVDLRARRGARVPRDRRLRRARRARRDGDRARRRRRGRGRRRPAGRSSLIAWLAAALGDLASFALGQRLGRRFLVDPRPALRHHRRRAWSASRTFFDRHGPQGDPRRALHRHRPRGRPVPGRRVGHAPARLPAVEPARHLRCGRRPSRSSATPSTSPSPPPPTR